MARALVFRLRHQLLLLVVTLKEDPILEMEVFGSLKLLITDTVMITVEEIAGYCHKCPVPTLKTVPKRLSTIKQKIVFENSLKYISNFSYLCKQLSIYLNDGLFIYFWTFFSGKIYV